MVKFVRLHWFGLLLSIFVVLFMLFMAVIAVAPHNDAKMRGFTPCTYQMAQELSRDTSHKMMRIFKIVNNGYFCYFQVISEGAKQFALGKQKTPWENYLFKAESFEEIPEEGEPFSDDLLKANVLDDKEVKEDFLGHDEKGNDDEKQ